MTCLRHTPCVYFGIDTCRTSMAEVWAYAVALMGSAKTLREPTVS